MSKILNWKNVKIQDCTSKTNFCFGTLHLSNFNHVAAYKISFKNRRKMHFQPIFNKISSWAHMESKFDVLGIAGKLMKYVIHLSKKKKKRFLKNMFFLKGCPNNKQPILISKNVRG
jgi:hypothetical protein